MSSATPSVKVVPSRALLERLYGHLYTEINADVLLDGDLSHQFYMYEVKEVPDSQAFKRIPMPPEIVEDFFSGPVGQQMMNAFVHEFFVPGSLMRRDATNMGNCILGNCAPNALVGIAAGWLSKIQASELLGNPDVAKQNNEVIGEKEEVALIWIFSEAGVMVGHFPLKREPSGLATAVFQSPVMKSALGRLSSVEHADEAGDVIARAMAQRSMPKA